MTDETVDLICVGAGFAGLTAATRAAELGLKAVILERQADAPQMNNSRVATGVFHVAGNDVELPPDALAEGIETETAGYADKALTRTIADNALRTVDWLKSHGVGLERAVVGYVMMRRHITLMPARAMTAGLDWPGKGGDRTLRILEAELTRLGGALRRGVTVTGLVMDGGRITGVTVEDAAGERAIDAKAVLICDGGFQANPEMVKGRITPDPARVRLRAMPCSTGDGIRMAEAAGAALTELAGFYGHILSRDAMQNDRLWPYPNIDVCATGAIIVDGAGRRFVDEGRGAVFITNAIAALDDPLSASVILNRALWEEVGASGVAPPNPNLTDNGGTLIERPDLASLAAEIGVPADTLADTVAAYNAAVTGGTLDRLNPPRSTDKHRPYAIEGGPYVAIPVCAGLTNTMGGIRIDAASRVLDTSDRPIPGLYAAGSSTGGLEGGPNIGYVGGVVKAFVLGLVAGETAAADLGRG